MVSHENEDYFGSYPSFLKFSWLEKQIIGINKALDNHFLEEISSRAMHPIMYFFGVKISL